MHIPDTLPKRRMGRTVMMLLLIGVAVFFYIERAALWTQLDEWKLLPRPERFTELYLENHADLPRSVNAGQTVPFSFTVHNLEGGTMKYSYEVYALASSDDVRQPISHGDFSIDHTKAKTIANTFIFPENQKKMTIFIALPALKQEIHFILSN